MNDFSADELQAAAAPIASLISKSEKVQQKLAPGTWQHSMLRDNLNALHIAYALMGESVSDLDAVTPDALREALSALASMIARSEKAQVKLSPGTSQHTLLRNRIQALRVAESLIQARLADG